MRLTRCGSKHFYDADMYDSCPHCDKSTEETSEGPSVISQKPITGSPHIDSFEQNLPVSQIGLDNEADTDNETVNLSQTQNDCETFEENIPQPQMDEKPSLKSQVEAVTAHSANTDVRQWLFIISRKPNRSSVGWYVSKANTSDKVLA